MIWKFMAPLLKHITEFSAFFFFNLTELVQN